MTKRLIRKTEYTEEYLLDGDDALDCNQSESQAHVESTATASPAVAPSEQHVADEQAPEPPPEVETEIVEEPGSGGEGMQPASEECVCVVVDGETHCGPVIDEEGA